VSHIRPIIYNDVPPPPPPSFLPHPYSLAEFDPEPKTPQPANELLFKLQRQQLDDLNHHFWLDVRPLLSLFSFFLLSHFAFQSNTRFEAARKTILDSLPASASPLQKEHALSEFYKQWVVQESSRTGSYTEEWRAKNWSAIYLAASVSYTTFIDRLSHLIFFWRS
jgi:apoptogenic protein 1